MRWRFSEMFRLLGSSGCSWVSPLQQVLLDDLYPWKYGIEEVMFALSSGFGLSSIQCTLEVQEENWILPNQVERISRSRPSKDRKSKPSEQVVPPVWQPQCSTALIQSSNFTMTTKLPVSASLQATATSQHMFIFNPSYKKN